MTALNCLLLYVPSLTSAVAFYSLLHISTCMCTYICVCVYLAIGKDNLKWYLNTQLHKYIGNK